MCGQGPTNPPSELDNEIPTSPAPPSELDNETPPLPVQTVTQETPALPALDPNNLYVTISKKKLSQLENDAKIGRRIKAKLTKKKSCQLHLVGVSSGLL